MHHTLFIEAVTVAKVAKIVACFYLFRRKENLHLVTISHTKLHFKPNI